jgi:hypothetical protein
MVACDQGTVALLAQNCNLLIVSDAAGQLMLETEPKPGLTGLGSYAARSMDTLMERVRMANYADLAARVRTKLLRGMMFLHMKDGLDADVIRLKFSQEAYDLHRAPLSPLGVRKDFQKAVAELRTDLDDFSADESNALMACGYRMAATAFERDLRQFQSLIGAPVVGKWPFEALLREVESAATSTSRRELLNALRRRQTVNGFVSVGGCGLATGTSTTAGFSDGQTRYRIFVVWLAKHRKYCGRESEHRLIFGDIVKLEIFPR